MFYTYMCSAYGSQCDRFLGSKAVDSYSLPDLSSWYPTYVQKQHVINN